MAHRVNVEQMLNRRKINTCVDIGKSKSAVYPAIQLWNEQMNHCRFVGRLLPWLMHSNYVTTCKLDL